MGSLVYIISFLSPCLVQKTMSLNPHETGQQFCLRVQKEFNVPSSRPISLIPGSTSFSSMSSEIDISQQTQEFIVNETSPHYYSLIDSITTPNSFFSVIVFQNELNLAYSLFCHSSLTSSEFRHHIYRLGSSSFPFITSISCFMRETTTQKLYLKHETHLFFEGVSLVKSPIESMFYVSFNKMDSATSTETKKLYKVINNYEKMIDRLYHKMREEEIASVKQVDEILKNISEIEWEKTSIYNKYSEIKEQNETLMKENIALDKECAYLEKENEKIKKLLGVQQKLVKNYEYNFKKHHLKLKFKKN